MMQNTARSVENFLNANGISFILHEHPAVSPFGLINDSQNSVEVIVDSAVHNAEIVNFHPNRNTASLELTGAMFRRYLGVLNNAILVADL